MEEPEVKPGPKPRKRRTKPDAARPVVAPADLVRACRDSSSLDEVATKLGTSKAHVCAMTSALRKKGVVVKKFDRGTAIDVTALNAIAAGEVQ